MMRTQTAPKSESVRGGIQIQSVSRALEILNCFMGTDELGISELSAEMGLHKSTVFGLVNTMVGYGILEQVPSTKKYRLGMTLFTLGNLALSRIDIRSEARERCFPLAQKYPATIHLATQSMGELTCVAAPIFQKDGLPEMAISLSFPYGRIGSVNEEDVKKDLLACTRELSARLGYRG